MASADHPSILIAEGIELAQRVGHGAGGGQRIAPCVIGISNHLRAAAGHKTGHIALRIRQIEILHAVALHHIYHSSPRIATLQLYDESDHSPLQRRT